jgi:hypothetical protein
VKTVRHLRAVRALLAAALSGAPALFGQSAHWEPPGGSLPVGEVASLQLVFDDCSPDDVPVAPKVDGLRLDYQGQSSNISIINGTFSRSVTLAYSALLSKQQEVDIPEFSVATNKGKVRVAATHFNAAGATVGSTGIAIGDAATAKLEPASGSVWAGEVFDIRYTIDVSSSYYPSWGRGTFEWDPSPLVTEDWSQPEPFETHDSAPRNGLSYHTRAVAPTSGRVRLNPTSQLISLSVGVSGFGFFQQRQYQQFAVPGPQVTLEVRPLPPAPAGFAGAVGDFKIASKVVPVHVRAGEPVTWTVELSGSGNWPGIRGLPSREAPSDFEVIQPKPKRTQPPGKLFEATLAEDVVLVPKRSGSYVLPPLDFTYFDPKSGAYVTISAPGSTVNVDPAASAAPASPGGEETAAAPGAPAVSANPTTEAKAPEQPTAGLGAPVPPSGSAPMPVRRRTLAAACALPLVLLGLFWIGLALRRARATEPLRMRRAARLRLMATLDAVEAAPIAEKAPLLLSWQRDAAVLWEIVHAAPAASAFADSEWSALWTEADRFLYSADSALAPDWAARGKAALSRKTLRPFSPATLFLPRNLVPLLALVFAASATRLGAADPVAAYQAGNFAAAGKAWADEVSADPLDSAARHNLSLALAQGDRWGEAAGHAAAAFVQDPRNPAMRRQLVLACDKAGFVPEPLDALMQPGPVESLARLGSPGAWQRIGISSSWLLAASFGLLLAAPYGLARRKWAVPVSLSLLGVAVLAGASSLVAVHSYGIAADSRAVVVWRTGVLRSIPTEADNAQKTTPLPAGSAAVADKSFLGWIRLSFPNGQTGWVARSEVVYLWQAPPGG